jgi:predicted CXXCH cytochrome family protein
MVSISILSLTVASSRFAFDSGGVAECMGCHEMHGAKGAFLLQGWADSSFLSFGRADFKER